MNNRLQRIFITALGAFAFVAISTTYFSCNQDKCKAIACANQGVCVDGACKCPSGYEGVYCERVNRDRYLGTWIVTEKGTITGPAQYTISLEKGDNVTEIKIKNMRNLFTESVRGYVKADTVYIPQQIVNSVYSVVGSGIITNDINIGDYKKLLVRYKVTDISTGLVDDFGFNTGDSSTWKK